ncbi:radical SAM family heme chaperone HemW [Cylindrospermum sp. FACHB-282]|uniref:radical SAM family heme chaperone HemW n=1 Tax=Cylindrospermum sp. FACHB-282 TaxID=2692794 RepID=UPI001689F103|nr:radical SAM family heme chaperone HemW [Cylindrospermum sp. FACHB-282]MBD2387064.1 coproporphyrinogen III oxidase [Cylindrospermum sp. FACHB-282]
MSQKVSVSGIPSSAYVHIPFCRRRCFYCDFPVSVVGDRLRGETSGTISQYVEVLCQEIAMTPAFGQSLETIFFGGGTPSLLSTEQLQRIILALEGRFGIGARAEISMEMDPGTFDLAQITGYRSAGVNRVSLGVQAFQEELLKIAGRSHSVVDIFAAVELIRQVEVPEFSLDLISGLPHQSLDQWQDSLTKALGLVPTHISIYDLTIEPGTAFGRYYQPGDNPLPTDEATVKMYQRAQQALKSAGYEHYEISNYAQPGHQCRHNRVYWENRPYYGFGMGAASYVQGKRFTRPRKTKEYYQWVQAGGVIDCEVTPPNEILLETLMLGLRLAEGVSLAALAREFGEEKVEEIYQCLRSHFEQGWVEVVGERLRLSDPQGFLFSNVVLSGLFAELGE